MDYNKKLDRTEYIIVKCSNHFLRVSLILIFSSFFSGANSLWGQHPDSVNEKHFLANLDSLRFAKIDLGKVKFTPFIAPSYSPELEVLVSAGGLLTFKLQKDNPVLERSSIPFSVGYSSNKSLQINARFSIYGKDDKVRMVGEWWLKDMPDNYWGVGFVNGRNRIKSDTTTQYKRKWWRFYQKFMFQFKPCLFVGPIVDFSRTQASEMNTVMAMDPDIIRNGTDIRNTGVGVVFAFDSRDLGVNAYRGVYLDFSGTLYSDFLGGKQQYQVFEVDYRQYKSLGRVRQTLAWNIKTRATFGGAPWPEMSQLGNLFDFRGYTWGRYRDESFLLGVIEYRHMFRRKKPNQRGTLDSRSGFTVWVGSGSIGRDIRDYNQWLPTYGVGYRFETQPRMNVRIDYGRGTNSSAFYVTFNEAF